MAMAQSQETKYDALFHQINSIHPKLPCHTGNLVPRNFRLQGHHNDQCPPQVSTQNSYGSVATRWLDWKTMFHPPFRNFQDVIINPIQPPS